MQAEVPQPSLHAEVPQPFRGALRGMTLAVTATDATLGTERVERLAKAEVSAADLGPGGVCQQRVGDDPVGVVGESSHAG